MYVLLILYGGLCLVCCVLICILLHMIRFFLSEQNPEETEADTENGKTIEVCEEPEASEECPGHGKIVDEGVCYDVS